ncbi:hypothetical protein IDM30_12880 [Acinetobacter seifertii]|nr:hypothetical protein [Acinetobacter seifertii]
MPMIRFTTSYAYTDHEKAQISKIVQTCMESYFDTPPNDCFHFFEHLAQGKYMLILTTGWSLPALKNLCCCTSLRVKPEQLSKNQI